MVTSLQLHWPRFKCQPTESGCVTQMQRAGCFISIVFPEVELRDMYIHLARVVNVLLRSGLDIHSYGGPGVQYSSYHAYMHVHCCFAELFFFPAKHCSPLPSIFLLCWAFCQLFHTYFFYAESFFQLCEAYSIGWACFSALPIIFLLCFTFSVVASIFSFMLHAFLLC